MPLVYLIQKTNGPSVGVVGIAESMDVAKGHVATICAMAGMIGQLTWLPSTSVNGRLKCATPYAVETRWEHNPKGDRGEADPRIKGWVFIIDPLPLLEATHLDLDFEITPPSKD